MARLGVLTMRRIASLLGSAVFLVIAPGTIAGYVPWLLTRWKPGSGPLPLRVAGAVLIAAGAGGLLDSFGRFAIQGLGTPAPVAPPAILVATGLYRYVRNPMYCAVLAAIFGQALLLARWNLLLYGAAVWAGFHAFVLLYEEPVLRSRFGADYDRFRANVPRWLPRLTPWPGSVR